MVQLAVDKQTEGAHKEPERVPAGERTTLRGAELPPLVWRWRLLLAAAAALASVATVLQAQEMVRQHGLCRESKVLSQDRQLLAPAAAAAQPKHLHPVWLWGSWRWGQRPGCASPADPRAEQRWAAGCCGCFHHQTAPVGRLIVASWTSAKTFDCKGARVYCESFPAVAHAISPHTLS